VSLFQKSVLKNITQEENLIANRWVKYQNYLAKIDFIKKVKEEKYQDGFLTDIFENCLGYTKDSTNPKNFNLSREQKNETDSKKADGVIYKDNKIIGIIELKAQDTKNLDKVQPQAFWYLTQHSNARYVVISNFDELRFYIDKSTAYEKFNLFNLSYEEFKKLHLILSYESIKEDVPLKLKEKSATFEQDISKELYKDFSAFRLHLFDNLIKNNHTIESSTLLRLTQKICDRIIFILFAEDRGLLNSNTIKEIREEFKNQRFTNYALYDIYKFYFEAINSGNDKLQIPKYNGGLFAQDPLLDNLIIDDNILDMEAQKLSDYDFESDISVNILGHIFEQSLTDLEELQANIENTNFDKKKTKRKKDGIFYTPTYITKYIVDNTLGELCFNKKEELNLLDIQEPKNPKKLLKSEKEILKKLYEYREFLLNLKILDPACGSGAFLNQALEFLINEHKYIDKYRKIYENEQLSLYDIEASILENNLYGVDINEDAVEIAKLSLWLRTAQRGRPLTKLADKIVCANSLLNMPFEENSFNVVIGNPPYVRQESIKELKPQLKEKYTTFVGTADLYVYFYELGFNMLKDNGVKGFICSNKFFRAKYGEKLRELILNQTTIKEIIDFNSVKIFEDATVDSAITILKKEISKNNSFKVSLNNLEDFFDMTQSDLTKDSFTFISPQKLAIKKKVDKIGTPLKEWDIKINRGITTGFNEAFIIDGTKKDELIKLDSKNKEIIKPLLRGRDIKKYEINFADMWIITTFPSLNLDIDNYPVIKKYLETFGKRLEQSGEKGSRKKTTNKWFETQDQIAYFEEFEKNKIIFSKASKEQAFCFDNNLYSMTLNTSYIATGENLKFLLSILNSKLAKYIFLVFLQSGGIQGEITIQAIQKLPIPQISKEAQQPFIDLVDTILTSKEKIAKYNKHFDDLNAVDKIEIKEEIEKLEIIVNDSIEQMDDMVYKLYKLSEEEIKIVKEI